MMNSIDWIYTDIIIPSKDPLRQLDDLPSASYVAYLKKWLDQH